MLHRSAESSRLTRWQIVTGAALLVGYSGYYICRSNLSVAVPALIADPAAGVDRAAIGLISSAGIVAYAVGKSITGVAGDFFGGRHALPRRPVPVGRRDAGVQRERRRAALPVLLDREPLRAVGRVGRTDEDSSALVPGSPVRHRDVAAVAQLSVRRRGRTLRARRTADGRDDMARAVSRRGRRPRRHRRGRIHDPARAAPGTSGLPEPAVNAENIFGEGGAASTPDGLADLLKPYFVSVAFWLVCGLSFGMTLIREAFNTWIPAYLVDAHHLAQGAAARYSALFPLLGGVSCIAIGVLTDRLPGGNRVTLVVPAMAIVRVVARPPGDRHRASRFDALGARDRVPRPSAFSGPYTLLAGAIAMDMGGRKGSATAAGLIDTAGYVGGTLSGFAVGGLAEVERLGVGLRRTGWTRGVRDADCGGLLRGAQPPHHLADSAGVGVCRDRRRSLNCCVSVAPPRISVNP